MDTRKTEIRNCNMRKAIYFRMETKRFEDDLDEKIAALERRASNLNQSDANVQDIVQSAAQNMRTSLVVIKAYSNLLTHYEGQEKEEALAHMRAAALKIERIINKMIELTHVQKEEVLEGHKIDFEQLVAEVKTHLADDIAVAKPLFEHDFLAAGISYNRFNIFSLLFCVLHNSLTYRKEEELLMIRIRTYQEASYTVMEISDNGKGFDSKAESLSVFKPFSKCSVHQNGLGNGLYLVKTIIEKNGGQVTIESTPGKGTTIRLYLKPIN
jgi:light-regulated signal transduction histidine kinase (bacteriophytochrome)